MAKRTPKQQRPKPSAPHAAGSKNVANSVEKTTRKASSAAPAARVVEPKGPSLRDPFPVLHADFHRANDLFWRDLPELLHTDLFGRWVDYTPEGRLPDAVADDNLTLDRLCRSRGMQPGHYLVAEVLPDLPLTPTDERSYPADEA